MTGKEQFFEIVKNLFTGTVEVRIYFIDNHIALLHQFLLRESCVEANVGNEFHCPLEVFINKRSVDPGFLFGGVGVDLGSYSIESIEDVIRLALHRAFKDGVLNEVSQTLLVLFFIARTGIDHQSAVSHLPVGLLVDESNAVWQRVCVKLHHLKGRQR